jgi:hypothetical protein
MLSNITCHDLDQWDRNESSERQTLWPKWGRDWHLVDVEFTYRILYNPMKWNALVLHMVFEELALLPWKQPQWLHHVQIAGMRHPVAYLSWRSTTLFIKFVRTPGRKLLNAGVSGNWLSNYFIGEYDNIQADVKNRNKLQKHWECLESFHDRVYYDNTNTLITHPASTNLLGSLLSKIHVSTQCIPHSQYKKFIH